MVFMNGDNNLEDAALEDFREMARVGSTTKINVVVQLDRTPGETAKFEDWKDCIGFGSPRTCSPCPRTVSGSAKSTWEIAKFLRISSHGP